MVRTKPKVPILQDNSTGLGRRFVTDVSGATAVEYAVMALIFIGIVLAVSQLGSAVDGLYQRAADAFTN